MPTVSWFWWAMPNATCFKPGNPSNAVAPLPVFQYSNISPIVGLINYLHPELNLTKTANNHQEQNYFMGSLSVCMIVQNAQKTLAIALESLSAVYDELIIVDGGSTDSTCDIALSYGARIIHSQWIGNYSQQRNVYLNALKTDWFFTIDADEFIDVKTLEVLKFLKSNPDWATTDNYAILRKWISPFSKKDYLISEPYKHDWQSKLLKHNPKLKYQGLIHEKFYGLQYKPQSITGINIYHLDLFLHSEEERRKKLSHYAKTCLECSDAPAFVFYANYLYLPSSIDLKFQVFNQEEILPSVRSMLDQLEPPKDLYLDYLPDNRSYKNTVENELDINIIKIAELVKTVLQIGIHNADTGFPDIIIDLIAKNNKSLLFTTSHVDDYINNIQDLHKITSFDLFIVNSEEETYFYQLNELVSFKLILIDNIHKNANLYMQFLISTEYKLVSHRVYRSQQWALFENTKLNNIYKNSTTQPMSSTLMDTSLSCLCLREINYIIFPNWSQPEESLDLELRGLLKVIATNPDSQKTTLLINTNNIDLEEAAMFLSNIAMSLLIEEDLDISERLEISPVGNLPAIQWKALLPHIYARIILTNEDEAALASLTVENIQCLQLDSIKNKIFSR